MKRFFIRWHVTELLVLCLVCSMGAGWLRTRRQQRFQPCQTCGQIAAPNVTATSTAVTVGFPAVDPWDGGTYNGPVGLTATVSTDPTILNISGSTGCMIDGTCDVRVIKGVLWCRAPCWAKTCCAVPGVADITGHPPNKAGRVNFSISIPVAATTATASSPYPAKDPWFQEFAAAADTPGYVVTRTADSVIVKGPASCNGYDSPNGPCNVTVKAGILWMRWPCGCVGQVALAGVPEGDYPKTGWVGDKVCTVTIPTAPAAVPPTTIQVPVSAYVVQGYQQINGSYQWVSGQARGVLFPRLHKLFQWRPFHRFRSRVMPAPYYQPSPVPDVTPTPPAPAPVNPPTPPVPPPLDGKVWPANLRLVCIVPSLTSQGADLAAIENSAAVLSVVGNGRRIWVDPQTCPPTLTDALTEWKAHQPSPPAAGLPWAIVIDESAAAGSRVKTSFAITTEAALLEAVKPFAGGK